MSSDDRSDEGSEDPSSAPLAAQGRRNWDESFEALVAYKNIYGNCLVPSAFGVDSALGHWVRKQRRNENSGKLSPGKRDKLDEIGFVWKLRGDQHGASKAKAKAAKAKAKSAKTKDSKPLKPSPSPKKAGIRKRSWQENYQFLRKYYRKHGHCSVPRKHAPDPVLGQWVATQRTDRDRLTERQHNKLEEIGFDFDPRRAGKKRVWMERLDQLKAYKQTHGDCNVPYESGDEVTLGQWVAEQRHAYEDDRLSSQKIDLLEAAGLSLGADDDDDDDIDDENDKEEESETVEADEDDDEEEDEKEEVEGQGAEKQTDAKAASGSALETPASETPTPARAKVTLAEKWETQYERLVDFHRVYRHCVVPRNVDRTLCYWAQRQRNLNVQNKLKENRKQLLDALNFEWYVGITPLPENYFDEMIRRLIEFQQTEGHVDVPRRYLRGGLGEWMDEIKARGRDGSLQPKQADRLLRVGFTWMEDRESWSKNMENAVLEVRKCRRSRQDCLSLELEVENWLKVQFMLLEYDLMPPKREEKLGTLGLDWDGAMLSWRKGGVVYDANSQKGTLLEDETSIFLEFKNAAISWTPDRKPAPTLAGSSVGAASESKNASAGAEEETVALRETLDRRKTTTNSMDGSLVAEILGEAVAEIPDAVKEEEGAAVEHDGVTEIADNERATVEVEDRKIAGETPSKDYLRAAVKDSQKADQVSTPDPSDDDQNSEMEEPDSEVAKSGSLSPPPAEKANSEGALVKRGVKSATIDEPGESERKRKRNTNPSHQRPRTTQWARVAASPEKAL